MMQPFGGEPFERYLVGLNNKLSDFRYSVQSNLGFFYHLTFGL